MSVLAEDLYRRVRPAVAPSPREVDLLVENEHLRSRLRVARVLLDDFLVWVEAHGCRDAFVAHLTAQETADAAG